MRAIALMMLVLIGLSATARAQETFSLEPAQVQDGQVVNLRVDTPSGCTPFDITTVVREGDTVKVSFEIDDSVLPGGCPAGRVTPRLHSLGTFAAGNYTVEVSTCSNSPLPPFCVERATLGLSVFGVTGQRFTVPTLSGAIVIGLMLAVMAIGAVFQRSD